VITERNIVCFASGWDYHPTSKHHIMRTLANHGNHVIWVNWHASRRPGAQVSDLRAISDKIRQIRKGAQQVSDQITVLTPFQIPLPESQIARLLNRTFTCAAIRHVLRRLPSQPLQLWSFAPDVGNVVSRFDAERIVYYCVDAFGEFPGYDRDLIEQRERELIKQSDVIITTSEPLCESKKQLHDNVHLMMHGVDYKRLSAVLEEQPDIPADLSRLKRPVIGYVGVVGDWVDLKLVADLARQMPEASIAMIGPVYCSTDACRGIKNIHWLGERQHADVPAYLNAFDAALIPFKHVALTRNANPIKLYEYLAAGVPVVSTALPSVPAMDDAVWLADDVDTTVAACKDAITKNTLGQRRQRSELMKPVSWEAKIEAISQIVTDSQSLRSHRAGARQPQPAQASSRLSEVHAG
jgi:glycosyltransferase involved in cell wall biosynthesis